MSAPSTTTTSHANPPFSSVEKEDELSPEKEEQDLAIMSEDEEQLIIEEIFKKEAEASADSAKKHVAHADEFFANKNFAATLEATTLVLGDELVKSCSSLETVARAKSV